MEDIDLGFVFKFRGERNEHTVIFVTDDGYYVLCQDEDGFNGIWSTESIHTWLKDGTCKFVRRDNIATTIKFKKL